MLILNPKPQPRWLPVELAPGVTISVHVRPPTFEQLVAEHGAMETRDVMMVRLGAIIDWRDVVTEQDGATVALPFNAENLAELIRGYGVNALLAAVRPFFRPMPEDARKNSDAPQPAATSESHPLIDSVASDALPNSPAASD